MGQTGPQSPGHVVQFCPSSENPDRTTVPRACSTGLPPFRESRQDHSPMFYRSASLQRIKTGPQSHVLQVCLPSENPDRTTVPRACSTGLPPFRESRQDHSPMFYRSASLQRIQTGPQSHVLQVCLPSENPDRTTVPCSTGLPPFRESRQDHSPMFYRSASLQRIQTGPQSHVLQVCLPSENQDRTTVPRACSTVLPPFRESRQDHSPMFYRSASLQRIKTGPQSHVLQVCLPSENQDRTTVPRACSTVLPPFREAKMRQWSLEATQQEQLR